MTRQAVLMQHQQPTGSPLSTGILQRKCTSCGQHKLGGGTCAECSEEQLLVSKLPTLQAKLRISSPHDQYEQEAERIANQTMQGATVKQVDRPTPYYDDNDLSTYEVTEGANVGTNNSHAASSFESLLNSKQGSGHLLPGKVRNVMESQFGYDFSNVRLHSDTDAAQMNRQIRSKAFTHQHNIFFAEGEYNPDSYAGRHLLAHELVHVVQQQETRTRSSSGISNISHQPLLQRQDEQGGQGGAPPSGTGQRGSDPGPPLTEQAQEQSPPTSSSQAEEILPGRVQQVTISCPDSLIIFSTTTSRYPYRLTECQPPSAGLGTYKASVSVAGNNIHLTFPTLDGEIFNFGYSILPGQENPATLLANQRSVETLFVDSLHLRPHQPGCMSFDPYPPPTISAPGSSLGVELPERIELVREQTISPRALFEPLDFGPRTVFTKRIFLAELGWIDINGIVEADITSELNGSYGPVVIDNLCFIRTLGNGQLAARGRLAAQAGLNAQVVATGTFTVAGDFLSIFRVAALEGGLTATGTASANADLSATLELIRSAPPNRGFSATGQVELALGGELGFDLDATAGLRLLGVEIWRNTWDLADANIAIGWRGGVELSRDLGVRLLPGGFEHGLTAESVNGSGGSGRRGRRGRSVSIPDMIDRLMALDPTRSVKTPPDQSDIVSGPVCPQSRIRARTVGTRAHEVLGSMFENRSAGRFSEVRIPFSSGRPFRSIDPTEPRGNWGRADLVEVVEEDATTKRIRIGEIKPMNHEGLAAGVHEVFNQYGPKVVDNGANCALPRESQEQVDRNFCDDIDAQGQTVVLDDSGVSWSPNPNEFTMRLEREMRMLGKQIQAGVTGYKCLGWVPPSASPGSSAAEDE